MGHLGLEFEHLSRSRLGVYGQQSVSGTALAAGEFKVADAKSGSQNPDAVPTGGQRRSAHHLLRAARHIALARCPCTRR